MPKGVSDTVYRFLPRVTGVVAIITVVLTTSYLWAHWYNLGPSKDEWGLKYDVQVESGNADKLLVRITIADQGRLKPIHSVFVMAFSNPDRTGTNLVKSPVTMKPTEDGKLAGQIEVSKAYADRAVIRIFTMTVDGRSHTTGPSAGARYYDLPVNKFLKKNPAASPQPGSSIASPPATSVVK
mgnify:FL=1